MKQLSSRQIKNRLGEGFYNDLMSYIYRIEDLKDTIENQQELIDEILRNSRDKLKPRERLQYCEKCNTLFSDSYCWGCFEYER